MKRLITIALTLVLLLTTIPVASAETTEKEFDGYVYLTVERLTLGQGLALEPTKVGYYKDENLADITERGLGEMSTFSGDMSKYYIEHIVDGGEPEGWTIDDVPVDIMNAIGGEESFADRQEEKVLSAEDYTAFGGWMLIVDNYSINDYAGGVVLGEDTTDGLHFKNGSVVRLQFSAYGWGEDIGCGFGYMPIETTNAFPDRTALIAKVGEINTELDSKCYGTAYKNAVKLLNTWDISSKEIADALEGLDAEESSHSYEYISNSNGTHTLTCKYCGYNKVENCSFDDEDNCEFCECHRTAKIYGDVNDDGVVNVQDATLVQKYTIKMIELTEEQKNTLYFDEVDLVNIRVVTLIQKFVNNSLKETNIGTKCYLFS